MDRDFIERLTKLVVEVLDDMVDTTLHSNGNSVKIWQHKSPLPDPITLTPIEMNQLKDENAMVNINPYIK